MAVRGIELTSIEAKRYVSLQERVGQVKIDHNSTVTLIKPHDEKRATVEFRYTASYSNVGMIKLEGALHYEGDAKTLHDTWKDKGQMPPELASEIHTTVMRVCVPEAVGIARDLQLPPPIPLPQIQFQGAKKATGHVGGPEVA